MQTLIARGRGVARHGVRDRSSNESGNDVGMSAGGFGNKHNRGEGSFITSGQKRSHPYRGIKIQGRTVDDRLSEDGPDTSADQKQRDEHGAHSTRSQRKKGRAQFQHTENNQLPSSVMLAENLAHRLVVRSNRYEIARVDREEYKPAEACKQAP